MQSMKMLQFKISLAHIKPPVWRRFVVPSTFRFADLHTVIQRVMGWTDSHLHEFDLDNELIGMKDEDSPHGTKAETGIRLYARLKSKGSRFRYTYDFGDDWEHVVVLEEILNTDDGRPRCLAGKRNCPPEDCGGPIQYMELLAVRADPKHPLRKEYSEVLEWLGEDFDPEEFDLDGVNSALA